VRVVIRLKDHWKPKVDYMARGQLPQEFFPGPDFDALLNDEPLRLDGQAIDAEVHVGGDQPPFHRRRVGVQTPQGSGFFLTNLPPRLGPQQVADLSRGRWEVELRMKLDPSGHRLDEVDAERPCSLKTLRHASLMASTIAALLAPTPNLKTRPPHASIPRMEAPLHPRRLALQLAVSCQSIAHAFDLKGAAAQRRWDQIAALLTDSGKDPTGRRRPSVLKQRRGWKRQSVAPDTNRHHRQQMAA
jgi:hypothetical protein